MIADVLSTEMEDSVVQSYLPITALRGFEIINAADKIQVLQIFQIDTTNVHHLPHGEILAFV